MGTNIPKTPDIGIGDLVIREWRRGLRNAETLEGRGLARTGPKMKKIKKRW
jgi:hypothetical protein